MLTKQTRSPINQLKDFVSFGSPDFQVAHPATQTSEALENSLKLRGKHVICVGMLGCEDPN